MAKIMPDNKLDFSDVLIVPKRSTLASRSEVSAEREFKFPFSGRTWVGVPICVANMDTTGTFEMYKALLPFKVLTFFHKFYEVADFKALMEEMGDAFNPDYFAITTGIREDDYDNLKKITELFKPSFICIDVANGYSSLFLDFCKKARADYPDVTLVAGNVATGDLVGELIISCKIDIIKLGIGPGSVCTTRLMTGVGYPQLSAVIECSEVAHANNAHLMSDGGIQYPGDFSKAFGAGADFVMAGSIFSGHDQSGGELVEEDGKKYRKFYGMSSKDAMDKFYGGVAKYRAAEGKAVKVEYKGDVVSTIESILGGIRSTMCYIGARKLKHVPKCTTFVQVNRQVNDIYGKAKWP